MLVTLLIPVTAILLGHLVLGKTMTASEITGALVIGSAVLVIDGRLFNFISSAASTPTASR
jgi:drug/metabolite transporter (DMT)-like permease